MVAGQWNYAVPPGANARPFPEFLKGTQERMRGAQPGHTQRGCAASSGPLPAHRAPALTLRGAVASASVRPERERRRPWLCSRLPVVPPPAPANPRRTLPSPPPGQVCPSTSLVAPAPASYGQGLPLSGSIPLSRVKTSTAAAAKSHH